MTLDQAHAALADAERAHRCHAESLATALDRWVSSRLDSHRRTTEHLLDQWRRSRDEVGEAQAAVDALTVCRGCGETGCSGMARDCDDHLGSDDERADRAAQRAA